MTLYARSSVLQGAVTTVQGLASLPFAATKEMYRRLGGGGESEDGEGRKDEPRGGAAANEQISMEIPDAPKRIRRSFACALFGGFPEDSYRVEIFSHQTVKIGESVKPSDASTRPR